MSILSKTLEAKSGLSILMAVVQLFGEEVLKFGNQEDETTS